MMEYVSKNVMRYVSRDMPRRFEEMMCATVLIVEDDSDINTLLKMILGKAGYVAVQAYSGTEAKLRIEHEKFDLILLDLMLPGMTGEELIDCIREEHKLDVPIIIISAKASIASKVGTLAAGADDYITKPFDPEEVIVRVQATLRRVRPTAEQQASVTHTHRDLCLDSSTRRVSLKGSEIGLTAHEFDILHILIQSPDTVFSRERLYGLVWKSGYYGEDNTVNVHVSNIRKKLAAVAPHEDYIKTIWGIGFKLV
ncbi:MAG: response regulator transcription factor [Coriobacteriales bacterium]|jgi:DNA-binding response OmpR family regulator|nr:response regulator transcription factor [Coriobacteriales bacterium]